MKVDLELEKYFLREFNIKHSVVGGRANIILYSFFKMLPPNTKVVFPAVMCPSPLLMAIYAGMIPVLCDVDSSNGLITAASLKKCLDVHVDVGAVISVNLFGQRPHNESIYEICKSRGIFLVEDAAQGWSPYSIGQNVDLTILSFGTKKPLDCNGGGVGITNNSEIFKGLCKHAKELNFSSEEKIKSLSTLYGQMYYMLQSWERTTPGAQKIFINFTAPLKDLYFKSLDGISVSEILKGLENHKDNFTKRYILAQKYQEFFSQHPLFTTYMNFDPNIGPWRYGVLYKGQNRDKLLSVLRDNSIDVSSWYPSLEKLGFNGYNVDLKNSTKYGDAIVNLWVSEITEDTMNKCFEILKNFKE